MKYLVNFQIKLVKKDGSSSYLGLPILFLENEIKKNLEDKFDNIKIGLLNISIIVLWNNLLMFQILIKIILFI